MRGHWLIPPLSAPTDRTRRIFRSLQTPCAAEYFPVRNIHDQVNIPYRKKVEGTTPDQPHLYSSHAFAAPACGPRRLGGQTLSRLYPIRGHPAPAGTESPKLPSCPCPWRSA